MCETKKIDGYVSAVSFANLVYVMRKVLSPDQINNVFKKLELIFHFIELSPLDLSRAAKMKWDDFEDALQAIAAEKIKADYIATRNIKDFSKSKVTALTPTEIISRL